VQRNNTGNVCINVNNVPHSRNCYCGGKVVCITFSECVLVALLNKHAKRTIHTILLSVACLDLQYFLSHYHINE